MIDQDGDELAWPEGSAAPDISFRRQLWLAFGVFAVLVMVALGVLTYVYLGALRERALSLAFEKGQESADDLARRLQELAETKQSDIFTIVRDRREVDQMIGNRLHQRQLVERWQILNADGNPIAQGSSDSMRPGGELSHEPPMVEHDLLLDGKKAGSLRLYLSEPDMMRQVEEFQRGVRLKVLAAAGMTLALLLAGFLYVVRLLERTRAIHDQAETRLRLASLGALAGGLAHEIRNPLNAMNINVQLLEEDIAGSGAREADLWRKSLASTRQEIRRLDELVTNVLTYARPFAPDRRPVNLAALWSDLATFLGPELQARRIVLELQIDDHLTVLADAPKLRQAFLNVVRNAAQAIESMDGSGAAATRGLVRVRAHTDGGRVRVLVEDDGPGIPDKERGHLFRAFASSKPGGTGLGLPIARKILRAHGGDLAVEPMPPRGTRVVFTLPRSPAPAVATPTRG